MADRILRPRPLRVLCLDAGGIRGVIQIEILRALERRIRWHTNNDKAKIGHYFDVIGGTCTGGVLAFCLAKEFDLDVALQVYKDMSAELFASNKTPYESKPLEKILESKFSHDTLSDIDKRWQIIVPCVNEIAEEPKLVVLTNWDKPDPLIYKVAQATCAHPGFYEPVDVDIGSDPETSEVVKLVSGYLSYNPTLDVLTKINERDDKDRMEDGIVVSLGTGIFPQHHRPVIDVSFRANILGEMKELFQVLWDPKAQLHEARAYREAAMARSGHLTKRASAWCRMIGATYERLEPHIGSYIDLDCKDPNEIDLMITETVNYLHEDYVKDRINEIARLLVRGT